MTWLPFCTSVDAGETGEKIQMASPDELLMHGTLADGGRCILAYQ